jgi:site-specific DNA-methyltransferase (adenine-specific)
MFDLKKLRKLPKGADLSHIQPDLRDKAVPITALSGHPDNPRKHPDANKQAIAGSLRKYLQRKPVVANATEKGLRIEAGHGVYGEMLAAGAQYIAVTVVEDDAITELGYMLADNRTGDLSEDDAEKLEPILRQLIEAGEEVEEFGWDEATVKGLLRDAKDERNGDESSHDDDIPQTNHADELQKEWQTERGQVWEIPSKSLPGQCHRVVCGDCRIASDVAALLDGRKVNVAFTSPPYASQRKYDEESGFKPIKPDSYVEWFEAVQANVRAHLAQDGSWFVNIKEHCEDGQRHLYVKDLTIAHVRKWGWRFVDEFCWRDTKNGVPGGWQNRFKDAWEPVFHFASATKIKFHPLANGHDSADVFQYSAETGKSSNGSGLKSGAPAGGMQEGIARPSNVIEIAAASGQDGHSAAFPVALPTFFIKAYSDPSDSIFDPFLGSGTTMIAAEREGRIAYGTEISPKYVAVILQRAKDAGLQPRRLNV